MVVFLWCMRVVWPLALVLAWVVAITTDSPIVAAVYSLHVVIFAYWVAWWWSEYRDREARC